MFLLFLPFRQGFRLPFFRREAGFSVLLFRRLNEFFFEFAHLAVLFPQPLGFFLESGFRFFGGNSAVERKILCEEAFQFEFDGQGDALHIQRVL